jgi:hypothetical protein
MKIEHSNIVTAFDEQTIGAKVYNKLVFNALLAQSIEQHDFSKDRTPGQAVLDLSSFRLATNCVSGGIGRKTNNPDDYVIRVYRGGPKMFLKRNLSAPIEFLKAVVYTREAYLIDPDVLAEPKELARIEASNATHVLVAVLAGAVESFVSPYRFVANLAGGNLDYAPGKMSHLDLVELAVKVKSFSDEWSVVAD